MFVWICITYANIYFLLEKYSCRRVQCKNFEEAYIDLINNPEKCKSFIGKSQEEITQHVIEIKYKKRDD